MQVHIAPSPKRNDCFNFQSCSIRFYTYTCPAKLSMLILHWFWPHQAATPVKSQCQQNTLEQHPCILTMAIIPKKHERNQQTQTPYMTYPHIKSTFYIILPSNLHYTEPITSPPGPCDETIILQAARLGCSGLARCMRLPPTCVQNMHQTTHKNHTMRLPATWRFVSTAIFTSSVRRLISPSQTDPEHIE